MMSPPEGNLSKNVVPGIATDPIKQVKTADEKLRRPLKVFLFRPALGEGGADRVTITLLKEFNRDLFHPYLVLVRKEGVWLDDVPEDIPIIDLRLKRLRFSWLRLASILIRERPDLLLSTSSGGNVIAALAHALAPDSRRSLVLSERNTFSLVRQERRPKWLPIVTTTRYLYRKANRIIAVSRGVAEDLVETLNLPEGLVTAIHNPVVDDEMILLAQEPVGHPWLDGKQQVLLAVGRLVRQKDYPLLLRALSDIRKTRRVRLIILGEGEMRKELQAMVKSLGLEDDVDLPGFVRNPFPFMRRCSVYVLSSKFEGLPGALIQAMACGAPSVATDCPSGPAEIIESGKTGFLVPVGDRKGLVRAIERLLDDDDLRRDFSEAGRNASVHFGVASMMKDYERALLSTIEIGA